MSDPVFISCKWLDAWTDGVDDTTLEKVKEKHRPIEMETRGWLLVDDDVGISLFYERSLESPQSYRGRTFIPRGMIKSIDILNISKPRKKRVQKEEGPKE